MNTVVGILLRAEGDREGAQSMLDDSLRLARRAGDRFNIAFACLGLACLAGDAGEPQRAAELHGVAQAFVDQLGIPWVRFARLRQDSIDAIEARLGETNLRDAYEQGRALTFDAAFDLALGTGGSAAVVPPGRAVPDRTTRSV
ncbi:MAG: hypothetical protein ACRDPM_22370 [Solirubrobacteraceae bacterium]